MCLPDPTTQSRILDIQLPEGYSPATPANLVLYVSELFAFLTSPLASSIIHFHPNDVSLDGFQVPELWHEWWEWAASPSANESSWKSLVHLATKNRERRKDLARLPLILSKKRAALISKMTQIFFLILYLQLYLKSFKEFEHSLYRDHR